MKMIALLFWVGPIVFTLIFVALKLIGMIGWGWISVVSPLSFLMIPITATIWGLDRDEDGKPFDDEN